MTLRALTAGAYAPSRFNHARFVLGERGQTKQHPGPPGWGFSAGLTTLPCKTPHVEVILDISILKEFHRSLCS